MQRMMESGETAMIEIAVCDDEKRICEAMRSQVEAAAPACRVNCFFSGEELLAAASGLDLVFLDIGMKGMDGMETARRLRQYPGLLVVFVTAYPEYVFDAFDVQAFHFLVKPVEEEKLRRVLEQALKTIEKRKERQPLRVKDGAVYRFIPLEQIYYAESSGRKILLHTESETVEFYGRMQELQRRLGDDFFRCHRGYLVHLMHVSGYDTTTVFLKNGTKVYLAKQKYAEFAAACLAYLRRTVT